MKQDSKFDTSNCDNKVVKDNFTEKTSKDANSMFNQLYDYLGLDKNIKIEWRVLYSDILKEHSNEEAEKIFVCGTTFTTPDPSTISTDFPRPWLYSRIFIGLFFTFILLWICCSIFENQKTLPGTLVIGSFIVPLSTMILFLN